MSSPGRHLTRGNQGLSLSLSRSARTGGREPWEQGWARTFLNNEGVSNFTEMEDYNVEAKWTMAEWNSQNTLSLLYKGFQVANNNFVRKSKGWEICQAISQRNKRYVSAEEINNCLLKWDSSFNQQKKPFKGAGYWEPLYKKLLNLCS